VLNGAIKKDGENGADKMARQLNKCGSLWSQQHERAGRRLLDAENLPRLAVLVFSCRILAAARTWHLHHVQHAPSVMHSLHMALETESLSCVAAAVRRCLS